VRTLVITLVLAATPSFAGFDLLEQDLDVDLVSSPTGLRVKASVKVRADQPLSEVKLLLPSGTVTAVTRGGQPLPFSADTAQSLLAISLPSPLDAGAETTVEVEFQDTPACSSSGRMECARSNGFTFMGVLGRSVRWYLISYDATDPFTGRSVVDPAARARGGLRAGSDSHEVDAR